MAWNRSDHADIGRQAAAGAGAPQEFRIDARLGVEAGEQPEQMARLHQLWLQGAERGDATAQRVVGDFYMRGVGIERSPQKAERWLAASSNQGDTAAMVLLGGLILEDTDNEARFPQAVELFRRAAELSNVDAEYNLGVCLRRGLGVPASAMYVSMERKGGQVWPLCGD